MLTPGGAFEPHKSRQRKPEKPHARARLFTNALSLCYTDAKKGGGGVKRAGGILLLCLLLAAAFSVVAGAGEPAEISIISANISGLPAVFSKYDRDVPASQKTLGRMLNESGYDIVCVQEDFGYHDIFAAEMDNYPYRTFTTGGVPVGDGVNIFSVYPIYNVERVAWTAAHGIFADGSDSLCPKGFVRCTVDVGGVLIELYNMHMDAYHTEGDQLAKKAQLEQLAAYIAANAGDRPVLITGDMNLTFHKDPLAEGYRILVAQSGFADAWIEYKNGGNYMQGKDGEALIAYWYEKFGGHDWGRWDSVERVFYRGGDGLTFTPARFEYVVYSDDPSDKKALTDHRMMECVLRLDLDGYARPADLKLEPPAPPGALATGLRALAMTCRFVGILLYGGALWLWQNHPVALGVAAALLCAVILLCVSRKKKKRRKAA